jgi:hypothetical protein
MSKFIPDPAADAAGLHRRILDQPLVMQKASACPMVFLKGVLAGGSAMGTHQPIPRSAR